LHVESVAWISERKDVLSTCFLCLCLLNYVSWVRRPTTARYCAILVLFALALMSKSMVVTLPVLMLLLDIWPLQRVTFAAVDIRQWRRVILEKVPFLGLALVMTVITVLSQARIGAVAGLGARSMTARVFNAW